jgi:hypothetical protein
MARGRSGTREDIEFLMRALDGHSDMATTKLVDASLGLVSNQEGTDMIRQYLMTGSQIQKITQRSTLNAEARIRF